MNTEGHQRHWHVTVILWMLSCACMAFLALVYALGKRASDLALDFMSAASLTNYTMRDTAFLWDHLADRFEKDWGQKIVLAQIVQDWQWLKYFLLLFLPLSMLGVRLISIRPPSSADLLRKRNTKMLAVGAKVAVAICLLFCTAVAGAVIAMISFHAFIATRFLVRPVITCWLSPNNLACPKKIAAWIAQTRKDPFATTANN